MVSLSIVFVIILLNLVLFQLSIDMNKEKLITCRILIVTSIIILIGYHWIFLSYSNTFTNFSSIIADGPIKL